MLKQLRDNSSDLPQSDEDDCEDAESEEDIAYYAEDDISLERNAEEDFDIEPQENTLQQSVTGNMLNDHQDKMASPMGEENNTVNNRIPSAMKARPKIPRTPIPEQKLEEVKKENEEIINNNNLVQKSPQNNKKKTIEKIKEIESQRTIQESENRKMIKSEATERVIEEEKITKEYSIKKELKNVTNILS